MAFVPHYQVTLSGGYSASSVAEEIWQFGFKIQPNVADSNGVQVLADAWGPAMFTAWGAGGGISSSCLLQEVKVAPIGEDGKYSGEPGIYHPTSGQGGGSGAPTLLPLQNAVVITTVAESIFRGPGRFGRFYLPGLIPTALGSDGLLTTSTQSALLDLASALVNVPLSSGDFPHELHHYTSTGVNAIVTTLNVGNVVDTQRRRRNQLTETRVSTGYPPG